MEEQARLHCEVSQQRLAFIQEKDDLLKQIATKFKRERKQMQEEIESLRKALQEAKSNDREGNIPDNV